MKTKFYSQIRKSRAYISFFGTQFSDHVSVLLLRAQGHGAVQVAQLQAQRMDFCRANRQRGRARAVPVLRARKHALDPRSTLISASLLIFRSGATPWSTSAPAVAARRIRFLSFTTKRNSSHVRGVQSSTAKPDLFTRTMKFPFPRIYRLTDSWHCATISRTCGICAVLLLWETTKVRPWMCWIGSDLTILGSKLKLLYSFTAYWFAASSFFPTAKILKSGLLVESKPSTTCVPAVNHTSGSPFYDSEGTTLSCHT